MDLELYMWLEGEEIKGLCVYNWDLFLVEIISCMMLYYENLLLVVVEILEWFVS